MSERYYTYIWLRRDGTPYYVGKGMGRRAFRRNSPDPERIVIQFWPNEADAYAAEKFLILLYGRIDNGTGCLRNRTDGGEGGATRTGMKIKPETRAKILGRKHSEETKQKVRIAKLGTKRPPFSAEWLQHLSESHRGNTARRGKPTSAKQKAAVAASNRRRALAARGNN